MKQEKSKKLHTIKDLEKELDRSCIQNLSLDAELSKSYQLDIKRDDLIHPIISGNKWRKLKYLLQHIENKGFNGVAAMGGRHSNFLHALAYACYLLNWKCELFIRGYPEQALTPTLIDCQAWGAKLVFVDRLEFKSLRATPPKLSSDTYWVPEGGLQYESTLGISEIVQELSGSYDYLLIASATGTSVAGLVKGCEKFADNGATVKTQVIGISVLFNQQQQEADVRNLINDAKTPWQIKSGYEFGGFAKKSELVEEFCRWFNNQFQIVIEPIYTGRSFYAVFDLMKQGFFKQGSRILLIHCGGLQGARK